MSARLFDEVVPSVLEVGAEEETCAALVGRVDGCPAEANEEHYAANLHLDGAGAQEAGEIRLELLLVGSGSVRGRAMDEDPPPVVCRRSLIGHPLGHLLQCDTK